jgi:hypothetical protein
MPVVLPPVQPDLLGLVDRAHDQTDADGEELDLGQRDADVPCDEEPLVEDPIQQVDEARASVRPHGQVGPHGPR